MTKTAAVVVVFISLLMLASGLRTADTVGNKITTVQADRMALLESL